jgi:selenocysteine lyase/cysteine desulfurase
MEERVPTFALTHDRYSSAELAERLAERGIAAWHGNYYALEVLRALGLEDIGGALRIGIVHYNTAGEIDRLLDTLASF